MWLFALFLAIPLIEITLFVQVGGLIGLFPTLAIVIVTALLGTYLVRQQGALALGQVKSSFSSLTDPTEPLAHGAMILFSGALLLTPGFFTDAVGFALLVPGIRTAVFHYLRKRVKVTSFTVDEGVRTAEPRRTDPQGDTIDGEWQEIDTSKKPTHGNSGWTRH